MTERKITSALISVFYKEGLEPIVRCLHQQGVQLLSTGGTQSFIQSLGLPVTAVESLTGFPEILGGRVKTLHPTIYGGILGRREREDDREQMHTHHIPALDLVIVDLYPFEETVATTQDAAAIIEKIDIGGISLIRAAAKNFNDVLVCPSRLDYGELLQLLKEKNGSTSLDDRRLFAAKAFNISSHYDTAIFHYFQSQTQNEAGHHRVAAFKQSILPSKPLRYGENPHQQGVFYGDLNAIFEQLHGKALSYNNLVDIDAAIRLIAEFEQPACAVIKHTNACGCAEANDVLQAWERALAADSVSAFGGIIIFNRDVDEATAIEVSKIFFEVIIAPGYDTGALAVLQSKKNRIIIRNKGVTRREKSFRSLLNGVIEQDRDQALANPASWKVVTTMAPAAEQVSDLLFAEKCVKHLKSNTIVLAKDRQLVGMGCGQTSRVDALKQAIAKAKAFGFSLQGCVMASDAFFPFSDCVELAHAEGIAAVIQPGGSIRDADSIVACNRFGMAMVTTGLRHFLH